MSDVFHLRKLSVLGLLLTSSVTWGHSAMFPDGFAFNNEGEGDNPADALQQQTMMMGANSVNAESSVVMPAATCTGGSAAGYPCKNVDLKSFLPKQSMGANSSTMRLNDIWGWTDPQTGKEIAIVGMMNGTSFVDVTDPENPDYLAWLPSHNNGSDSWRDVKTYNDHAFIVADGSGNNTHGLQVFDLTRLRTASNGQNMTEDAHLGGFGASHNININEDSGYAYVVGANQCSGGLYMVDISNPKSPAYAGCYSSDGYTHDAQCVNYAGPDSRYTGREICIAYNEDTITIVDVTNKSNPVQLERQPYSGSQYTHQGWFMEGPGIPQHTYLIMNDELDEQRNGHNTTSHIYDATSLTNITELGRYVGPTSAIDHNLYTKDGYVFESNYRAGLRILDGSSIDQGTLTEVAYFDTIPGSNSAEFSGTWSNYAYFASGNIITSDIEHGLFTLKPDWDAIENGPTEPEYCTTGSGDASYEWIGEVKVGDFTNTSGSAKYSDFTGQTITAKAGGTAVTLTPAFNNTTYNEYWTIWVDLNSDGDFTDAGEEVFTAGPSKTAVTGSMNFPASAIGTKTRMRVAMRYNAAPSSPCGSFNYGEVEDYTVDIVEGGGTGGDNYFENTQSYDIPDNNATGISSPIDVSRTGASGTISVAVDISHTYKGDLVVDVIAPNGNKYNIHNRSGGSANDIKQTFNVAAGTTEANGTWNLKVVDKAGQDVGTINSWSMTFAD